MRTSLMLALGGWCALTLAGAHAATTTNALGASWTELNDGTGTASLRSVVESDGVLIAVGDNGWVQTSSDHGATWTQQDLLGTSDLNGIFVTATGRLVVVASAPPAIYTSDDNGVTWSDSVYPTSLNGIFGMRAVTELDGSLFAVGSNGGVLKSSDDGDTWTRIKAGVAGAFRAIATDDDATLVAVGDAGVVMSSDDAGVTWTAQTSTIKANLWSVAWNGTTFAAVGEKGSVITSADGTTWTDNTVDAPLPFFTGITAVGDLLVTGGVGPASFRYSSDKGVTWTQGAVTPYGTAKAASGYMQGLAVTTDGVFAVGLSGEVWFSNGSFELWAANAGLTGTEAVETADPDGDGISNLLEYTLGLNPAVAATPTERALLPAISFTGGTATANFSLPATLPSGITATIETSTGLTATGTGAWTTLATRTGTADWTLTTPVVPPASSPITVTTSGSLAVTHVALSGNGYFRLRLTR